MIYRTGTRLLATLLISLALFATANAAQYRGEDGTIISFYTNGSYAAYVDGHQHTGRWWWTNYPYQFQMEILGQLIYGSQSNDKRTIIVSLPGHGQEYLNYIGSRGKNEDREDNESWFTSRPKMGK